MKTMTNISHPRAYFDIVGGMLRTLFYARRLTAISILLVCVLITPGLCKDKDNYQQAAPLVITRDAEKWAEKTLHHLSLEEKIGQLFMMRAETQFENVSSQDYLRLRDEVQRFHLAGLLLTVRTAD